MDSEFGKMSEDNTKMSVGCFGGGFVWMIIVNYGKVE